MGQKVNPISNRLGVIRGWDSNWYGGKKYGETLLEDSKIRKYLRTRLAKASVSRIIIERTLKMATVTIATSRPGLIIGIKVWICRGEVYGKKELAPVYQAGQKEPGGRPRGERKGGFRNKKNNNR